MNAMSHSNVAFFDIGDPGFRVDSLEVRVAAEASWWARTPAGLAVLRYQECLKLLQDQRLRPALDDMAADFGATSSTLFDWLKRVKLSFYGESKQCRRVVRNAFTQRSIDTLRPFMRSKTQELIDGFVGNGSCEFMTAFADPYPSWVIAKLLGIPAERFDVFLGLSNGVGLAFSPTGAAELDHINAAIEGLCNFCEELVEQRRENLGDDFVSTLITSESDGQFMTSEEVGLLLTVLVAGGQGTTRNQLGLAMLTFSQHPEQWRLLAKRPELGRTAVEELMRINPAFTAIPRVAIEDFTFQGVEIPKGTYLLLFIAAANAEPDIFGDAPFDITAQRPTQLSFGAGVHYCLGAGLARAEMSEALPILASRLGDIALTGPLPLRPHLGLTGPVTLPLHYS